MSYAAGLDCSLKYIEHERKPLLQIFSHCFKRADDRNTENTIEKNRERSVHRLKLHLADMMANQDTSKSTIALGMLDEDTRKLCKQL
jgi:hypothetical protein